MRGEKELGAEGTITNRGKGTTMTKDILRQSKTHIDTMNGADRTYMPAKKLDPIRLSTIPM